MLKPVVVACFGLLGCASLPLPGLNRLSADDSTGMIAVSGDVEIMSVKIRRGRAAYAVREADLTYLELELLIDIKEKFVAKRPQYLIKLTKLEPILDNKGLLLSTKKRLSKLSMFEKEDSPTTIKGIRGKGGPTITLVLEAPTRGADALNEIKGTIEIIPIKREIIRIDNVEKLVDKPLQDKRLDGLIITPTFKQERDFARIKLDIVGNHKRLLGWEVFEGDRRLRRTMEGRGPLADRVQQQTKGFFREKLKNGFSLELALAAPGKTKTFQFHFKDVKLP